MSRLVESARLAGFAGAHAVWCVSSGETLVPFVLWSNHAGERTLERMIAPTLEECVAKLKERMESVAAVAQYAVGAFDGFINANGIRTDTVFLTTREFNEAGEWVTFGVPYTPKKLMRRFAVHKLWILDGTQLEDHEKERIVDAFFSGVGEHPEGAAFWNKQAGVG